MSPGRRPRTVARPLRSAGYSLHDPRPKKPTQNGGRIPRCDVLSELPDWRSSRRNVVAVEHVGADSQGMKLAVHGIGHRAFAAATKAGKPDDAAAMTVQFLALAAADARLVPGDFSRLANRRPVLLVFHRNARMRIKAIDCFPT